MKHVWFMLCAVTVAGCNVTTEGRPEITGTCGAESLQHLVGQSRDAFDAEAIDGPVRVLPPGAMMTMDYRRDRLNVELSEDDQITRIWCG
jgi:hypothetical protein